MSPVKVNEITIKAGELKKKRRFFSPRPDENSIAQTKLEKHPGRCS